MSNMIMLDDTQNLDFEKQAIRVSMVSIAGNILLSLLKLLVGLIAHSGALVSDAVHSASDVFSSVIVIIGVKIASRDSDADHPYGHERMESVAAILLAVVLAITGLLLGRSALVHLNAEYISHLPIPGKAAIVAAVISIFTKEAMYWYTRNNARRLDSGALMADAWHHRSDALSSVGSLVGIVGARMGYAWFDPAASLIICVFILKAAVDIFIDAINKLVDKAVSVELQQEIRQCVLKQNGVLGIAMLQTREFGNRIYVDVVILADESMTLFESNLIAETVHEAIEQEFAKVKHITVGVKPLLKVV